MDRQKNAPVPPCAEVVDAAPAGLPEGREMDMMDIEEGQAPSAAEGFPVGDIRVRVRFRPDGGPLEDKLKAYFLKLKT